MDASWGPWVLSAVVLLGAIWFFRAMPGASDFRMAAGGLGMLALAAGAAREELRWHLLWLIPVVIVGAYFYSLRRLFGLMRRINKIQDAGLSDPEEIRRALQDEVDEYNRDAPDDQKMR